MLVPGKELLEYAVSSGRSVGSFNTYNIEITSAIIRAAEAHDSPIFLAIGTGALDYAGFEPLTRAALAAAEAAAVPVALHLDHCSSIATIRRCVEAGYTSIMVDGSRLDFEANIALTREAVEAAGGVAVEAELGGVAGEEDRAGDQSTDIPMTDPAQAAEFASRTGIASLAVAIGNAHGVYSGEPRLDFDRLRVLAERVSVPLVLHGASGISDEDIERCIQLGVHKINVNTEIRQALFGSLQDSLKQGVAGYDVTRLFGAAMDAMQASVEEKIALLSGKAIS